jgi:hypothetical protein
MFANRKKRRKLQGEIDALRAELRAAAKLAREGEPNFREQRDIAGDIRSCERRLAVFESSIVTRKAPKYGIDIPSAREKPEWWLDDTEEQHEAGVPNNMLAEVSTQWLSAKGRAIVISQIHAYWKGLVELLITVLALLVAILALLK